ncbi:MAG: FAD-binding oxidoreductase [Acidobacteriota bacterium]|nr:FAD-binding oxidoreductase [Acidobacteriota bacterium]
MQVKTQRDEIQDYLIDASNLQGGNADKLFIPESREEIAEILREAYEQNISVTISGARTGTVGGAIPFGGFVISLEKFKKLEISKNENGGTASVGAGVLLTDVQKATDAEGLFYPPDPTEWSCQMGGTVATNASGGRSFKYGSTRDYVERLEIVLPDGDFLNLKRGEVFSENGFIEIETENGNKIKAKLPTYKQPNVRKNTSGYFSGEKIDAIDLFIGSEGTLGIVTEIELKLLPKPKGFLSGIVFFQDEKDLLNSVIEMRKNSFETRQNRKSQNAKYNSIDATVIEYFDGQSLKFISEKFPETPEKMAGAIFFEQETTQENEDELFEKWNELLEKHNAEIEKSWFAINEQDLEKMREFRHALPVSVNERIVKYKQRKVGTDMAVPDEKFESFLKFYKTKLDESGLEYVIFGHIGDNHLHANMIPKNASEMTKAKHLYGRFIAQAIMLGGTISAEHGIGKLKSKYLYVMYGERYLNEMAELKKAFDRKGILGRENIMDAKFLIY